MFGFACSLRAFMFGLHVHTCDEPNIMLVQYPLRRQFATCSTDILHYCTLLYYLISLICMYFRSSDVLFYTYCITYTYYIAAYVCMYINFDVSPRSTACALIRTSLGLLERSDTSEKPPPNPNFLQFAGAIRHFV